MTLAGVASLTDTALRSLGITTLGQRKKLLAAAAAMVPAAGGPGTGPSIAAAPAHSSSGAGAASPSSGQQSAVARPHAQEMPWDGSGSTSGGRITDFFQPKGGPRPAPPPMQAPLDGLLAAAKPRPSIANFFQPAAGGSSGATAGGRSGAAAASGGPAASAPARGPNPSGSRGDAAEHKGASTCSLAVQIVA